MYGDISICLPHFTLPRPTYLDPFQYTLTCLQLIPISVLTLKKKKNYTSQKHCVHAFSSFPHPSFALQPTSIWLPFSPKPPSLRSLTIFIFISLKQFTLLTTSFLSLLLLFHPLTSLATPFIAQVQTPLHLPTFNCWIFSSLSHGSSSLTTLYQ